MVNLTRVHDSVSARHALILAVPENSVDEKLNLPVVREDVELLARALRESSYDVTIRGANTAYEVSKNLIAKEIRDACDRVPENGTLLIFFSGHGIHSSGHDYLFPWDADLRGSHDAALFRVSDVLAEVDGSRAKQIVFFIDACREGFDTQTKASSSLKWGTEKRRHAQKRQYSTVFSCKAGEYSHYTSKFSLFSRALSEALSIDHPARTLKAVSDATQERLGELCREYQKSKQTVTHLSESDLRADPGEGIICDGHTVLAPDEITRNWRSVVRYSKLWRYVDNGKRDSKRIDIYRSTAEEFAARAEYRSQLAANNLGSDPWYDIDYAKRTVDLIEDITAAGGAFTLTLPEVALLLAAPFVREDAYSSAISEFALANPKEIEVSPDSLLPTAAEYRRRLEVTLRSYPQPIRRVRRLRANAAKKGRARKSDADSADVIMLWLLHRQLAKFAAMWLAAPDGTLAIEPVIVPVETSTSDKRYARDANADLSIERILKLAKCVRCEPDRLTRRDMPHPLEPEVGAGGDAELIRERLLGSILCLAGWMALDVRAANDAVVDHVGIGDPLDPRLFVRTVAAAKWTAVGGVRELNVECGHPAIDFVLRDLVTEANRILTEVTRIIVEVEDFQVAAKNLPGQLSSGRIDPVMENGRPAYTTPHQQFTLAQSEVRELLMGDQLYGDPNLAIREMYQNALDACRYRQARLNFLGRNGKQFSWKGRIAVRQGVDRGRHYVECEDNGIGMGAYEIGSCFARAGKRFADLPEFIEEQELWLQCNPKIEMTPNSQFGIGVLSYFMIADEIELTTCRLDREGRPGRPLSIRIPGGGTLFRVQPAEARVDAGTRVRLYLREDWNESSCEILKKLLFVAEFDTEATDKGRHFIWQAGRAPPIYTPTNNPDFWWTSDKGQVLVDGIATELPRSAAIAGSYPDTRRQPFGALINLRNRQRPKLTVDRKNILEFDEAWVVATYAKEVPSLLAAQWLCYTWLWAMPEVIRHEIEHKLIASDAFIPIGYGDDLAQLATSLSFGLRTSFSAKDKWDDLAPLRTLGFPIRVIGLEETDPEIIGTLAELLSRSTSADERLQLLRDVVFRLSGNFKPSSLTGIPRNHLSTIDVWAGVKLAELTKAERSRGRVMIQRMAIFVQLGFPAPDWLRSMLPTVDVETLSAARKLEKPLPARPLLRRIGRLLRPIAAAIGNWFDRLPEPMQVIIGVGGFAIFSYVVISLLIAAAKFTWGLI